MSAHEDDASSICHRCGLTFDIHELLSPNTCLPNAEKRLRAAHDAGEWWSEIVQRAFVLKVSEPFLAWSDCLELLDELERLRGTDD